jgi:hypothetical protein
VELKGVVEGAFNQEEGAFVQARLQILAQVGGAGRRALPKPLLLHKPV